MATTTWMTSTSAQTTTPLNSRSPIGTRLIALARLSQSAQLCGISDSEDENMSCCDFAAVDSMKI